MTPNESFAMAIAVILALIAITAIDLLLTLFLP